MPIAFIEVPRASLDLKKSHVRIERGHTGWFLVSGAIGHPDVIEATVIPARPFKARQQAMDGAAEIAERFGIEKVWIVD